MGTDVFVRASTTPGDVHGGDGSSAHPYRSVARAIASLNGKTGRVRLYGGQHFIESVELDKICGQDKQHPIYVEPVHDGTEIFIDSCLPEFLRPNGRWEALATPDGVQGEYRWSETFDREADGVVYQGAFFDRPDHTRLVSYDLRGDLQSTTQTWARDHGQHRVFVLNPDDPHDPPTTYKAVDKLAHPGKLPTRRPWVYMGPGIWFDGLGPRDISGHVHIRMAHTTNNVSAEWPDYDGPTDPNDLPLALSREGHRALELKSCAYLTFRGLTLRFGSPETVVMNACHDIVLDHCRIWSGSRAVYLNTEDDTDENRDIVISHCEIDGGIPTWYFRSDRKDEYRYGPNLFKDVVAKVETHVNRLGHATSGVQISGVARCFNVEVHHCEIVNAHDSYVFGNSMRFHHNWVDNLNDDGIALSGDAETTNAHIYCNVMTRCLTALSFATEKTLGEVYIYANLFDLREPTLGVRPPHSDAVGDSLRQGHFFKDGRDEGEIHLFHNTCLVMDPGGKGTDLSELADAGFAYYVTIGKGEHPRTAFNNIFVAAFPHGRVRPIAFLAPGTFTCETNGNTFFRIPESDESDQFIVRRSRGPGADNGEWKFADLSEYHRQWWVEGDPAEYEHRSLVADPDFHTFDAATGAPHGTDDLRLRPRASAVGSPAWRAAVKMPHKLRDLYFAATRTNSADRGCYPGHGPLLTVGVDDRREFPPSGPRPGPETHPGVGGEVVE